ncbi:putative transcription factor CG1-CAMTA family [Helianthus annuus]|nr:putative transcription factor CG1-CAMTA family [Helianthus annuus]
MPLCGTIVLFDRKMLRNFRKDGHNWKKKKDGKTVKEAHEHLKVSLLKSVNFGFFCMYSSHLL